MTQQHRSGPDWRKSSYSDADGDGDCVEVDFRRDLVGLRDSKSPEAGALRVTARTWRAFLAGTRVR
ncbi:protein of unknown function [Amycolatopsis marina]|uniref:DUF397 domain-containing protein n=1 Tax=Amycolatopsis marina TaxID=490629 RepID=A0A1I1ATK8_9PSEU|nr:DUF397 domain-containing protein [Amycolatopsis marina]SFB39788.1 protein of unknown function [Amycolatopsis marina]